ncbi:DUF1281 domain-containing protein [Dryocola clanedunensis]|uniref:DUF1281 domain-containing protein n=1 Tax=Cedecea sulfonylureivorans TaxID=3051154 RepID=UPI001926AEEC|nr:DUF1281 domain-containing protein [Cedecea sulfonylureivorans]
MPNWCANRLIITGTNEARSAVCAFANGELYPSYARAINQSLRLFIAGCGGLLRPVSPTEYAPYPAIIQGVGCISPENLAFSEWLVLLGQNAKLDEDNCQRIDVLYQQSGLAGLEWDALPESVRILAEKVMAQKSDDWGRGEFSKSEHAQLWQSFEDDCQAARLDMKLLIPTRLACEINGFNGGLLTDIATSYGSNLSLYGVKWPHGYASDVTEEERGLIVDFDTPWSSPDPEVIQRLSERYGCDVVHYFAETGGGFCGFDEYRRGTLWDEAADEIQYSKDTFEECGEIYFHVCGPEYLVNNMAHYIG